MRIDPVVELAEELRAAETSLRRATSRGRHSLMRSLLAEIGYLESRLSLIEPTTPLGAAELIRRAAEQLLETDSRYARTLVSIADRWSEGRRELTDLVWLRALAPALANGAWGETGVRAAGLLRSALAGASRPLLVYRAASPEAGAGGVASKAV